MKKFKYRQDKRKFVTLTNGKKKNIKSLVVGDEYHINGIIHKVYKLYGYPAIMIQGSGIKWKSL